MKNALTIAALGLAIAIFALGPTSADADHCGPSYGHGSYSGGGYYGNRYYGGVRGIPTDGYGHRSYYAPNYRTYSPNYGGSYSPSRYGSPYYRSGYSHGAGFGTRSNLYIPGLIGG